VKQLLVVTANRDHFADLSAGIQSLGASLNWAASGGEALAAINRQPVDLVLADEDLGDMQGLELIKRLVVVNPLINCALVSSLSPQDYHEASEGLGILMQLPSRPNRTDGQRLLTHLDRIGGIGSSIGQ
jgi:CheY-like chemotaxis protein